MTFTFCTETKAEKLLIVVCTIVLCYYFIEIFKIASKKDASLELCNSDSSLNRTSRIVLPDEDQMFRESEYFRRVLTMKQVCDTDIIANISGLLERSIAKKRSLKKSYCSAKHCPIIMDEEKKFMFCFVPKVASTEIKRLLLSVFDITIDESIGNFSSPFHDFANRILDRVSPMTSAMRSSESFFKAIFVRHPFDRLVSAFRSKAEAPRDETLFFYKTYWDKIIRRYRRKSTIDDNTRITFREFVRYLIETLPWHYDDHWAPYWTRCNPCLVGYDFIGKLETAAHDFPYAFKKMGITHIPDNWWSRNYSAKHSVAMQYFGNIPRADIIKLYQIYWLDFQLFGYTLDGFIT